LFLALARDRLSHEAREESGAPLRQFPPQSLDHLAQQFEEVWRLKKAELWSAVQLLPDAILMFGRVGVEKLAHLAGVHRLHFNLWNAQRFAAQIGAVIEFPARKENAVSPAGGLLHKCLPLHDQVVVFIAVFVWHLVERVQQQQDTPLPQEGL